MLEHPNAFVVISKSINPGNNLPVTSLGVTGEWNIRVKNMGRDSTSIAVNLVNPKYITYYSKVPQAFKSGSFQSTGIFEKSIYNIIK
ncbi:MAG TPA: hypothetical protein VGO09_11595 [Flavisolibacter sp.]|nr:hypothetical protein [Flavisolibacter sp.]